MLAILLDIQIDAENDIAFKIFTSDTLSPAKVYAHTHTETLEQKPWHHVE